VFNINETYEVKYGNYQVSGDVAREDQVIADALSVMRSRSRRGPALTSPEDSRKFCRRTVVELGELKNEALWVTYVDTRHQVMESRTLVRGALGSGAVSAQDIAKLALETGASAVIFARHHPCGKADVSDNDTDIAQHMKRQLGLLDIKVLDYMIMGHRITSLAELGIV